MGQLWVGCNHSTAIPSSSLGTGLAMHELEARANTAKMVVLRGLPANSNRTQYILTLLYRLQNTTLTDIVVLMTIAEKKRQQRTLLVFNCHEPWVYQLGYLGCKLDIIVGLKGRYHPGWDEQMRPLPANSRLIKLDEALKSKTDYYCIITHNTSDLLDVKFRNEPKIIVLHSTLEGRLVEEKVTINLAKLKKMLHQYLEIIGGHAVATSMFKGESWGFTEDIVLFGLNTSEYYPHIGETACGLRICNFIESRRKILMWDFYEKAFSGLPVRLVGHNPTMPGVRAADSWEHLKKLMQSHRFYIHTADPRYESGFNMASVEAMTAGLPIIGNNHPTSPIKHGVSGFLSDDPVELRKYAMRLLADKKLALEMGRQARQIALDEFSIDRFRKAFWQSIEHTRRKWKAHQRGSIARVTAISKQHSIADLDKNVQKIT
jgi:hypothetical protein